MKRAAVLLLFLLLISGSGYAAHSNTYAQIDRCLSVPSQAWNYRTKECEAGPAGPVDRIYLDKSDHWMAVYRAGHIIREFRVALGVGGLRPKQRAGDGRVPEGVYAITAHNPDSAFHLSLRISYPSPDDELAARDRDVNPGGDIMIHGLPSGRGWIGSRHRLADWTDGCIAVTNPEMDWLYSAVPDGTPVEIRA